MCEVSQALSNCIIKNPNMLPNLIEIDIDYCNDLMELPPGVYDIIHLQKLIITNCHNLSATPEGIGCITDLESQSQSPTTCSASASPSWMVNLLGLLRVRVCRGTNLAVRDFWSLRSDPYIVIKMGKQRLKTNVIKKNVNPEWNEDLTLSIEDPNLPIMLTVYDEDKFSLDEKMGDAEFDIKPLLEGVKMHLEGLSSDTILKKVQPNRQNCLAEESCIILSEGKVFQDMHLKLRNVECGEVKLRLQWIDLPGSKGV
ncbi:hypothetical protein HHK36_006760 [Tetracentron sinense]|uniref:C2 domain-containing protein n=1 Tax=Tetracentron sinense TaxID=13715 RepID=A0A835DPI4_TETSI|nr:hypothetical protein HHK36_006760 [Tetracentron sinense]